MSSRKRPKLKAYIVYGSLGLGLCTEIAVAGLIGWMVGGWLDARFHMNPWGTTLGIMLFTSISFVHIVIVLKGITDRLDKEEA